MIRSVEKRNELHLGIVTVRNTGAKFIIDIPTWGLVQLFGAGQSIVARNPKYFTINLVESLISFNQLPLERMFIDQQLFHYTFIDFLFAVCLSKLLLNILINKQKSESGQMKNLQQNVDLVLIGGAVSFER